MPRWLTSEQGTEEWYAARRGCLTASNFAAATSFLKNGQESAERFNLKFDILREREGGEVEQYETGPMEWGKENEAAAREEYESRTGLIVMPCGFALHDTIDFFGASPDGLIGESGYQEIKCPNTTTHRKWMREDVFPAEHKPQCLAGLIVTGREWCDLVSYDPRLPDLLSFQCWRYTPTDEERREGEKAAVQFLREVEELKHRLKG